MLVIANHHHCKLKVVWIQYFHLMRRYDRCLIQLSRATLASERWQPGSYAADEGVMNSAALKKPKNPRQQAAGSMTASGSLASYQTLNIFRNRSTVIGSLDLDWAFFSAWLRLIPFRTYSRRGMDWLANGSP